MDSPWLRLSSIFISCSYGLFCFRVFSFLNGKERVNKIILDSFILDWNEVVSIYYYFLAIRNSNFGLNILYIYTLININTNIYSKKGKNFIDFIFIYLINFFSLNIWRKFNQFPILIDIISKDKLHLIKLSIFKCLNVRKQQLHIHMLLWIDLSNY